jgi:hypothetical protein
MSEEWAAIVREKNQEIEKWSKQALALSNRVEALREDVARLTDELDVYRAAVQYTFEAINKFEATRKAALTQGKGGANGCL